MEEILNQILAKLENMESDIKELRPLIKEDHKTIKELKTRVDESHQWIRVLFENKEFQKAEMDNLKYEVSKVEGVLKGFDKSMELFRKAQ